MTSRFERLITRHRELDRKIETYRRLPLARSPEIGRLKRIRLAIKDEIQRMRLSLPTRTA
jgi:uncharacterized protein YdcH (DUF465 family)